MAVNPVEVLRTVPKSLTYLDELPGAANVPGVRLLSEAAGVVGRTLGQEVSELDARELRAPRTPLNGPITAHRRFAYGSVPLDDVKRVRNHFGMTVNDVVMTLGGRDTAALAARPRRAARPRPLVAAVPVSVRTENQKGELGNQVSVMVAALPTHVRGSGGAGRGHAGVDGSRPSGTSSRCRRRCCRTCRTRSRPRCPGWPPGRCSGWRRCPACRSTSSSATCRDRSVPLYVAGARVEGIYPVSAVTDMTGGLNITLFSYDGHLDFGLIACREMVPDVWHLVGLPRRRPRRAARHHPLTRRVSGNGPASAREWSRECEGMVARAWHSRSQSLAPGRPKPGTRAAKAWHSRSQSLALAQPKPGTRAAKAWHSR